MIAPNETASPQDMSQAARDLVDLFQDHAAVLGVIGLGYVGLPLVGDGPQRLPRRRSYRTAAWFSPARS